MAYADPNDFEAVGGGTALADPDDFEIVTAQASPADFEVVADGPEATQAAAFMNRQRATPGIPALPKELTDTTAYLNDTATFGQPQAVEGYDAEKEAVRRSEAQTQAFGAPLGTAEGVTAALGAGLKTAPAALRGLFDYTGYQFYKIIDPLIGTNYARDLYAPRLEAIGRDLAEGGQFAELAGGIPGEIAYTMGQQLPMLPVQLATGGAASAASATASAGMRNALTASAAFGGLQSASQSFSSNVAARVAKGESLESASDAEMLPSITSGLITGAITKGFGATGIESIFRQGGLPAAGNRLFTILKQGGFEVAEEVSDEALQIGNDLLVSKTVTPEEALKRVGLAATAAMVMGTGVAGVHATMQRLAEAPPAEPAGEIIDQTWRGGRPEVPAPSGESITATEFAARETASDAAAMEAMRVKTTAAKLDADTARLAQELDSATLGLPNERPTTNQPGVVESQPPVAADLSRRSDVRGADAERPGRTGESAATGEAGKAQAGEPVVARPVSETPSAPSEAPGAPSATRETNVGDQLPVSKLSAAQKPTPAEPSDTSATPRESGEIKSATASSAAAEPLSSTSILAEAKAKQDREQTDMFMRDADKRGGFTIIPSAVTAKLAPETSTTPNAYRVGRFAQGVRNWWFGKGGALPKPLRDELVTQRQNIDSIKAQGGMMGRDIKFDIDRVKSRMKDKEAAQKLVNEVLDGDKPLTDIADAGLRDSVARARNFVDALTKTTLDNGIVDGTMADTFRTNMGKWMRRYYSAFDPEAGRTYDNVLKAAYGEPMERAGLKDANLATLLKNAEADVRGSRKGMTDGEVEAVLRGLLDRETMEGAVTGQAATSRVAKDISSLIRRKEISPAIRAWMGEEKNPLLRFEKSINFMAQLITRHETQKAMRDFGMSNGLFSKEKTGRYTVEVSPDEMKFTPKRDAATGEILKDADGNPLGEFSTRTDKSIDVFRGLYTSPEFAHAMKTMDGGVHGMAQQMGAVGKVLSMFAAETKMAKVPLNPGSWATNALGGLMMNFANGTAMPFTPRKSGRLFSTAFQAMRADRPMSMAERTAALNVQLREMHARLVTDGILNSNITMRDLEASTSAFEGSLLETNAAANRVVGAARLGYYGAELGNAIAGPPGAAVGGAAGVAAGAAIGGKAIKKGLQKFSQKSIGTADNFWKTVAYLDNFETYVRAGRTPAEAAKIAAEITRDTMPTYEKIPEGLRSLSKMGVVSTFFQFNYEVIRNTFNTAAIGRAEMASGNPVLVKRGARRLAGLSAMIALASSIAAKSVSGMLIDDDDGEKQKALNRSFVPPWDKNNGLVVTKLENGSASYVNHGYIIPQAQLTRAATAAMNGDGAGAAIDNIFGAYMDDFVSAGVHIGPLIEAAVNQKGFRSFLKTPVQGSQVTYKQGAQGYWERFAYVLDKTVKPGAVGEVGKIKKAVTNEEAEYGRKYTLQERAARMLGLRENTYDLKRTLEFKLRDLQSQWRNTGNIERNIERRNLPAGQAAKDTEYVKTERDRLKKAMQTLKKDAATLGLSDIESAQKKAGVALELR